MDDMVTRKVAWSALDGLVPDALDRYWQLTLQFLDIAKTTWPTILAAHGRIEPAARRDLLIEAEAARLTAHHDGPVIAAGSTGSMPATAALLAAIARLPRGAVVLPGLDLRLDAESFGTILPGDDAGHPGHPGHPQAMLAKLIEAIGVTRGTVATLGVQSPALAARETLMSEALRPAETTHLWRNRAHRLGPDDIAAALDGVAVVEAVDDREEALAIAVALREAVETPDRVAALVTPDRSLAERVSAELARWGIAVRTPPGRRSTARRPARWPGSWQRPPPRISRPDRCSPCSAIRDAGSAFRRMCCGAVAPRWKSACCAGPPCRPGSTRWPRRSREPARSARAGARAGRRRGWARPTGTPHRRWWRRYRAPSPASPRQDRGGTLDLMALAAAHEAAFAALAAPGRGEDGEPFDGPAGEALAGLFDTAREQPAASLTGTFADYPSFFHRLMAGQLARRAAPAHPRVRILGPLEARLLPADRVVLGGLDEGRGRRSPGRPLAQPPDAARARARSAGAAHRPGGARFRAGARRARRDPDARRQGRGRADGRLALPAAAGGRRWARRAGRRRVRAARHYLAWARALDCPGKVDAGRNRAPKPPRADARPNALSVTEIETLAARSLHDLCAACPQARAARSGRHAAAARRPRHRHPRRDRRIHHDVRAALPADPVRELIAIGRRTFRAARRLSGGARLLVAALRADRALVRRRGKPSGAPTCRDRGRDLRQAEIAARRRRILHAAARADRIERLRRRRYAILDYKTGARPTDKQVRPGSRRSSRSKPRSCAPAASTDVAGGASIAELVLRRAERRRAAGRRGARDRLQGRATPSRPPTTHCAS